MSNKEYTIYDPEILRDQKIALKNFILENSDTVIFECNHAKEMGIQFLFFLPILLNSPKKNVGARARELKKILEDFKEEIIKTEKNDQGEVEEISFKIAGKFKDFLENSDDFYKPFQSLENPRFFKDGKAMADIISHEPIINLHYTDEDILEKIKKGV